MKKVLCAALLLLSFTFAFGQDGKDVAKKEKSITFFGVDFSLAKAVGVGETPGVLKNAFDNINMLFTTEAKKYNIYSYFSKENVVNSFDMVNKLNRTIDESSLIGTDKGYTISPEMLAKHVKAYETDGSGMGLIFVAERLDKLEARGYFHVVFFDLKTKEIILDRRASGNANGFGVRNFWANPIYKIVKAWSY